MAQSLALFRRHLGLTPSGFRTPSGDWGDDTIDVLLGAGVVAGVVTTILFVGRPEVPSSGPPAATSRLRLVPAVAPTGAGLFMDGRF